MPSAPRIVTDLAEINAGLGKIRLRRRISHLPFLSCFVLAGLMALLKVTAPEACHAISQNPVYQLFSSVLVVVGMVCVMFISVVGLRCPRCGNFFHCGEHHRNDFTRKCLRCGLRLNGSNASDLF